MVRMSFCALPVKFRFRAGTVLEQVRRVEII